jgi:hypothetical protein
MGNFSCIMEVLADADIDAAAVAFDGERVWALPRARMPTPNLSTVVRSSGWSVLNIRLQDMLTITAATQLARSITAFGDALTMRYAIYHPLCSRVTNLLFSVGC